MTHLFVVSLNRDRRIFDCWIYKKIGNWINEEDKSVNEYSVVCIILGWEETSENDDCDLENIKKLSSPGNLQYSVRIAAKLNPKESQF